MLKIVQDKRAVSLLVGDRPGIQKSTTVKLFCTISPNPSTLHTVYKTDGRKRVEVKMPYGRLPQKVQYEYCLRILDRCYLPFLSDDAELVGTWELNKTGNVHLHLIIYDKIIHNKTHLEIFRRNILNCEDVIKNMKKVKKSSTYTERAQVMTDWMNNIVYIDKPLAELIKYLDKDYEDNKDIFSNYTIQSGSEENKIGNP